MPGIVSGAGNIKVRIKALLVGIFSQVDINYCDDNVLGAFGDGDFSVPLEGSRSSYKDRGITDSLYLNFWVLFCLVLLRYPGCIWS